MAESQKDVILTLLINRNEEKEICQIIGNYGELRIIINYSIKNHKGTFTLTNKVQTIYVSKNVRLCLFTEY